MAMTGGYDRARAGRCVGRRGSGGDGDGELVPDDLDDELDLVRVVLRFLAEYRGIRGVEAPTRARQQVVVEGLPQQRMAERVAGGNPVVGGNDEILRRRLLERRYDLVLRRARDACKERLVGCPAPDRHRSEQSSRRLRQPVCACKQHVAKACRQLVAGSGGPRGEQLLGEERVALGALVDRRDDGRIRLAAEDRLDLGGRLGRVERYEPDQLDRCQSLHLGKPRPEGVTPVELVGPIRCDDTETLIPRVAGDERREVARRRVGPVQVLDDEDDRPDRPDATDERQEGLEQSRLRQLVRDRLVAGLAGRRAERRQQPGELDRCRINQRRERRGVHPSNELPQRFGDGRERQAVVTAEVDARAAEDDGTLRHGLGYGFGDQPALADPGLPADEDDRRLPRRASLDRALQLRELGETPDEDRARDARAHDERVLRDGGRSVRRPTRAAAVGAGRSGPGPTWRSTTPPRRWAPGAPPTPGASG